MPGSLGPAKGKSFDGSNVLGLGIVTPDEIADPYALAMTSRVSGLKKRATAAGTRHWR
jgi:2-keto-4-pentenoate hydratase/2-oxohepta-3-ene-1,7-dioic acid hydratase in catechol pathway